MKSGFGYIFVILSAVVLTGCASFSNNEVAEVQSMPDVSQHRNKPSAFVQVRFYRGDPGATEDEIPLARFEAQKWVEKVLNESGLFSKYSFDEAARQEADHALNIDIYNHGNVGAAAASGFITGATLFLVPAPSTDNYTVEASLADNTGTVISKVTNKDSITTWFGLWFVFSIGHTPDKAIAQTVENQLRAVLVELVRSGKLKYSQFDPDTTTTRHMFAGTQAVD